MRRAAVLDIIQRGIQPAGYRVSFDRVDGKFLVGGWFPERDEPLIETEALAWAWAIQFAAKTFGRYVNIYVIDDNWVPVPGYEARLIENR